MVTLHAAQTGKLPIDMASPGGPIVISDRAVFVSQVFYGIAIPLLVLSTVTLGYRIYNIKARRALWSDGCIVVGYVSPPFSPTRLNWVEVPKKSITGN